MTASVIARIVIISSREATMPIQFASPVSQSLFTNAWRKSKQKFIDKYGKEAFRKHEENLFKISCKIFRKDLKINDLPLEEKLLPTIDNSPEL
jgi:hypothetical protein